MPCYFIYNNIKVSPFKPFAEAPIPGFRVLAWDSWTIGTLLDLGEDAGFIKLGHHKVHGQLWLADDLTHLDLLEGFCGVDNGITVPDKIPVTVPINELEKEELTANTFVMAGLKRSYNIIRDGKWKF